MDKFAQEKILPHIFKRDIGNFLGFLQIGLSEHETITGFTHYRARFTKAPFLEMLSAIECS